MADGGEVHKPEDQMAQVMDEVERVEDKKNDEFLKSLMKMKVKWTTCSMKMVKVMKNVLNLKNTRPYGNGL